MSHPAQSTLVAVLRAPSDAAPVIAEAWDAGEAVLPLDPRAPARELDRLIERARPTHLVDDEGRHQLAGGLPVAGDVCAVVPSSGTTGRPKLVELTAAGRTASVAAVEAAVGSGRWLCCLPVHHVAGLAVVARAWCSGLAPVVHDRFAADAVAAAPQAEGADYVSLVPTMVRRLVDAGYRLDGYRQLLLGGAPLAADLAAAALAAGGRAATTYGMTETWGGVVHDGRPLEGVDVEIDGAGAGAGAGEILLRGPMVMRGYRVAPDATAAVLDDDGWLRTGDLGAREGDGRLRVVGRRSEAINTGGVNVSPAEVEAVLAAHAGIEDVCVAGSHHPEWGEIVTAFVVAAADAPPPTLEELREFARPRLAGPKLPRRVVAVPAIPRTASGKPQRHLLPR